MTKFNEGDRFGTSMDMTWKGYDFDIINELDEEDYVRQGSRQSKSVTITEDWQRNYWTNTTYRIGSR